MVFRFSLLILGLFLLIAVVAGFIFLSNSQVNQNLTNSTSGCNSTTLSLLNVLWQHVYNPTRLQIFKNCTTVTGTITFIRAEADGDYHIGLKVDPQYNNLLNGYNYNSSEHGDLVLEPICQRPVTQSDAIDACNNFTYNVTSGSIKSLNNTHILVIGSYVLDTEHGWMEIHPVSSIQRIP